MPIPLFATSLDAHMPRIAERLTEVAASGRYILGPEVAAFEEEFARIASELAEERPEGALVG